MKIGFIGLGKMGAHMVERLLGGGHEIVIYDRSQEAIEAVVRKGAARATSHENLVGQLPSPKIVWLMVPSGEPVEENIDALLPLMMKPDIIIDGGNSNWRETQKRAERIKSKGVSFIDCGTSGGLWGLENGYCLMLGGRKEMYNVVEPILKTLAPEDGYMYCGPNGAGHFVKMVHNGIEYGMMQSCAEGFEIMEKSPFDLDLKAVSRVWQHGSVIRSWLLELVERALTEDPKLEHLAAYVQDSGEGRWTVQTALDLDVPAPVITHSLLARLQSRDKDSFTFRLIAALRNQFGGHAVRKK